MSIELHCPQCRQLIRAPDHAGGKRGKCPYCKNSVYIPTPPDQGEEIGLAPIDEEEERKAAELRREASSYVAAIDHVADTGRDVGSAGGSAGDADYALPPRAVADLGAEVEAFVVAMRDSRLDAADAVVARLKPSAGQLRAYVEGLLLDELPPEFEGVPPPVVKGFLKSLLDRLG